MRDWTQAIIRSLSGIVGGNEDMDSSGMDLVNLGSLDVSFSDCIQIDFFRTAKDSSYT